MNILNLLFLSKTESYECFIKRIEGIFKSVNLNALLNEQIAALQWLLPDFMKKDTLVKQNYIKTCCNLIANAINKAQDKAGENDYSLKDISKFLSFESKAVADERLLSGVYLQSNFILTLLQLAFFALVYTDFKTRRRFELAYNLWRNAIEFSFAGCVEELGRMLPYYMTYYKKSVFIIDPISGEIKRFLKNGDLRNTNIIGLIKDGIYSKEVIFAITERREKVPLVEYTEWSYKEISKANVFSKDMRKSERMKSGNTVEKMWLSTDICQYENEIGQKSSYYLKDHLFIALMVYGLEAMKYVVMEGQSILTIDHIDGVHFHNNISNLSLLTRCQNAQKERGSGEFYFNFYEYFNNRLEAAKRIQDNYDFRKRC